MVMEALSSPLGLTLLAYGAIGGTYLLVLPALMFLYLKQRWYTARSIERLLMYFMVFLLFPGLLLLSPFLNFRPQPRQVN
jgi:NAD(P)H-quinone oxidoreductase subunit L